MSTKIGFKHVEAMKKLSLLFVGCFCLTLISCKTRFDNLAANSNDDVYANPYKDPKQVVKTQNNNAQYQDNSNQQQVYNPNSGKIAATHADSINPNYKDPNFNYDDYYDNAYAARVSRFQNPIYGTGYYDSYYTNQYSYTGNPSMYGNSIYNSYPSSMYSPYNNYGMGSYGMCGYGTSMYGGGYGSGLSVGVGYSSGYYSPSGAFNNAYYNPYYSMGYGYNPYGMYGYSSYGMGYGYSPYGYGMGGYGGYNPYSTMYSSGGGYSNPYDYNSSGSNTYNGPRVTHSGGNSTTASAGPRTGPLHDEVPLTNPHITAVSPSSMERFNQVSIPKENMVKITEAKSPTRFNPQYQSVNGNTMPVNAGFQQQNGNHTTTTLPSRGNTTPNATFNPNTTRPTQTQTAPQTTQQKPTRWFNTGSGFNDNNSNGGSYSAPAPRSNSSWGGGNSGFGGGSGGSFGGGRSGGGHGGGRR